MRNAVIRGLLLLLMQALFGPSSSPVAAAQEPDGKILSSKPWPLLPNYESLDDFGRGYFPQAVYDGRARKKNSTVLKSVTRATDSPCAEC